MHNNRALLLDRDGVINDDKAYVGTIDRFVFLPGLFPFLRSVRERGYRLAILTNQAGIARGYYSREDYQKLTSHMLNALKAEGIEIELVLECFEHPEGQISAYKRESFWRKPNAGMVLDAVRRLNLNSACSAFLGDNIRDMQAAQSGGIGQCLWLTSKEETAPSGVTLVKDYAEALKALSV